MSHGFVRVGWGRGGREVEGFVIVVGQNMGAAAASSFALVLCSMGSP